jgi:peptidoglycan pentaglycine glycine transferase (the first glycine)
MPDGQSLQARVSEGATDPGWDEFVAATPGGDHLQTTSWAAVKRRVGWRAARLIVERAGNLVGGCQLLLRDLPLHGAIGYVPRAPLVVGRDPAVTDAVLDALTRLARREHVAYLKVQPPVDRPDLDAMLVRRGFVVSGLEAAPTTTTRIDLRRSEDDLLRAMRKTVRYDIRHAQRRGVTVRAGSAADAGVVGELVRATALRQRDFAAYPSDYYEEIWRSFDASGQARLLLAERGGAVLAFVLLIALGESAVTKAGGWSGADSNAHPNELLHWTGIQWARKQGYRYYDFDGIHLQVARAVQEGRPLPQPSANRVPHFKLRFGGEVVFFSPAYDVAPGRVLGPALRVVAPRLGALRPVAARLLGRR